MMGSQITREVDSVLYTRAGIEMGVAASKTFTAQIALIYLIALKLSQIRETLPPGEIEFILDYVYKLPRKIQAFLDGDHPIEEIAQRYHDPQFFLYLGRQSGCRCARGRAEAEGDLVHPDRGVLGGGDEARPDRAPRRADAGRRGRDEHPRLRQDRLEHPGGPAAAPTSSRSRRTGTRTSSTTPTTSSTSRRRRRSSRSCSRSCRSSCSRTASRVSAG